MVLLAPQPNVARVLQSTRVDQILDVFYDLEQALEAVRGAQPNRI